MKKLPLILLSLMITILLLCGALSSAGIASTASLDHLPLKVVAMIPPIGVFLSIMSMKWKND